MKMPQTHCLRAQTSWEPAQSTCTWTCDKSNFIREFAGKMSRPKTTTTILREPVQSKCASHTNHFLQEFTGKMTGPRTAARGLHQPTQSNCAWTSHNSHFMREFTGKNPGAKSKEKSLRRLCASLRSRNSH